MPTGCSGTPLSRKLGFSETTQLVVLNAPGDYESIVGQLPEGAHVGSKLDARTTMVHLFVTERERLSAELIRLRQVLEPGVAIWVSWPKRTSRVPTTVTEDVIRQVALPLGFVDIKVCAVTEVWSGLKLVVRKELRPGSAA